MIIAIKKAKFIEKIIINLYASVAQRIRAIAF